MVSVQNKAKSLLMNHRLAADTEVDPENHGESGFGTGPYLLIVYEEPTSEPMSRADRPRLGSRGPVTDFRRCAARADDQPAGPRTSEIAGVPRRVDSLSVCDRTNGPRDPMPDGHGDCASPRCGR